MKRSALPLTALAILAFPSAASAQTFYSSRAAWNGAVPSAALEDFEDGNPANGSISACPSPASSTSNNACFSPGDIVGGVTFSSPPDPDGLAFVDGYGGGTKSLIGNYLPEAFQIDFNPPVVAVAADLVSVFTDSTVTITAYAPGGGFVFSDDELATGPGFFWGFTSITEIGRLVINSQTGQPEGVDNLAFSALRCGDGIVTSPEPCDTSGESATCDDDCSAVSCGDGNTNEAAGEQCDTAGSSAGCDGDCTFVTCGDGTVNAAAGEACDDGGQSSTCDIDCTPAVCGDGTVNGSAGEACDDGGPSETCNVNCRIPGCGDGFVGPGEDCDVGAQTIACDANCTFSMCGDGFLNANAGEQCDDGNLDSGDGCSPTCLDETSGEGGSGAGGEGGSGGDGDGGSGQGGSSGEGGRSGDGGDDGGVGPTAGPHTSVDAGAGGSDDEDDDGEQAATSGDGGGSGADAADDGCGCALPGTVPAGRAGAFGVIALGVAAALRRQRRRANRLADQAANVRLRCRPPTG